MTFGYDVASRLITINNASASISRSYFNDNLLSSETKTTPPVEWPRTVTYDYDADGNRNLLDFPGYAFRYNYTGRNQLLNITGFGAGLIEPSATISGSGNRGDGSLGYDFGWLAKALAKAGPGPAEAASMRQFAGGMETFAAVYTVGTLGPVGIYAGGWPSETLVRLAKLSFIP